MPFVQGLGAHRVIDAQTHEFEKAVADVDVVLDTIGGDVLDRSFAVIKPGGVLVSAVATPNQEKAARHGVRAFFFLVEVTSRRLEQIGALIDAGELTTSVGECFRCPPRASPTRCSLASRTSAEKSCFASRRPARLRSPRSDNQGGDMNSS